MTRRDLLERLGRTGVGLASAPLVAWQALGDPTGRRPLRRSAAVARGQASRFTILHTSDIHAQLRTHDEFFYENGRAAYHKRGGLAVLKTMVDRLRAEDPANTILIDGGDCIQGGGVAALSQGRAIVPLMDRLGYDLILPGNWEVVYGKDQMMRDLGSQKAHKVCANMFHATADRRNGELIFPPYWTTVLGGVKIGFIGYTDPLTPRRQSPAYSRGIAFKRPTENVARLVDLLRRYEGCAAVFLVTHLGLAQQIDLANQPEVEGVDLILGADTHERVRVPIQAKYSRVTEPGAFGSFVARLDVVVENNRIRDLHYELLDVDPERDPPDAGMAAAVEHEAAPYQAELGRVVGSTSKTLVRYFVLENPMDNFITDAVMWRLRPDIAVSNGFRFCPPLEVPDGAAPRPITNDDLWSMVPVDSPVKLGRVTGRQLLDWLETELHNVFAPNPAERFGGWVVRFKGLMINFTARRPRGRRINSATVGGKPLDPARSYRVAACEREGDPNDTLCRIRGVKEPSLAGMTVHQVLREYLAEHSPIAPAVEGRVVGTDVPADLLSQLEGYDYQFR
ncbi:MAG: bifunctional metallophosphatase/5'-nucleotidase [Gemmatimonadales bacterium]